MHIYIMPSIPLILSLFYQRVPIKLKLTRLFVGLLYHGILMPRLYCQGQITIGASCTLPKETANHMLVLRLVKGDYITLFNGNGGEYRAQINSISRWQAVVEILSFSPRDIELPYKITLAQSIPEASKMDWIIEKAVELGVYTITPVASQRSVVRLTPERAEKRLIRWQSIIIAASEQSGRNQLAQLSPVINFNDWIVQTHEHPLLLLTPNADKTLADWANHQAPQAVSLMIGPEGGFSSMEHETAIAKGAIPLSMGTRILRTETAGTVATTILNTIWGGL